VKGELLERLQAARAKGETVALLTRLATGEQSLYRPGDGGIAEADAVERALYDDASGLVETTGSKLFVHVFNPPARLAVIGAVHIAQPLARMAVLAGFAVTVIDPRRSFAEAERFPDVTVTSDWPDDALAAFGPDRRTAVVTLTHDPKIDDPALVAALRSPAFYIGALGSRKTHAGRLARLREQGFDETALARIHGPVGLDIGALSPAEIAVSIMAQVIQARRAGARRAREAA
jgi:xanthine dehydrogenase accessory factor